MRYFTRFMLCSSSLRVGKSKLIVAHFARLSKFIFWGVPGAETNFLISISRHCAHELQTESNRSLQKLQYTQLVSCFWGVAFSWNNLGNLIKSLFVSGLDGGDFA